MNIKHSRQNQIYIFTLQKTARITLPLYKKIAQNKLFAQRWCRAVRKADLDKMERLIRQAIPQSSSDHYALSTNGIGYFIDALAPPPLDMYTNSAAIPPGKVQFYFRARSQRTIARAIQPLYNAIISSDVFSNAIVEAIKRKEHRILEQVIRSQVTSPYLKRIKRTAYGFTLRFMFPFDNYPYDLAFFRDIP